MPEYGWFSLQTPNKNVIGLIAHQNPGDIDRNRYFYINDTDYQKYLYFKIKKAV